MNLKEFEQLIKTCRKYGVTSATVDGVSLTLSDEAPKSNYKKKSEEPATEVALEPDEVDFDSLSDEEKLFWSAKLT
jgi:hypothetical protein